MRQHVQMPTKEVADFLVIILVYPLYVNQYISCLLTNTRIGGSVVVFTSQRSLSLNDRMSVTHRSTRTSIHESPKQ